MTIKNKILIPVIVLTVLVIVTMIVCNIMRFSDYVNSSMEHNVRIALSGAANMIEEMKPSAATASLYMAEDAEIIQSIKNADYDALLARAKKLQDLASIKMCTITDASGIVIVRTHKMDQIGDSLADKASIKSALSGKSLAYVEEGAAVRLVAASSTPVIDEDGNTIGVIIAGYRLDTEDFVDSVKKMYGCEASIVLGGERISTTVQNEDGSRAIGSKITGNISQTIMSGHTYVKQWEVVNRGSFMGAAPIFDVNEDIVGILLVAFYTDGAAATVQSFIIITCAIIVFLLAAYILLITFITNRIVTPINNMIEAAHGMFLEHLGVNTHTHTRDEIKNLTNAFNSMVENTRTRMVEDDRQLLRMSALINGAPQFIAYINPDGELSFFNEATYAISGYTFGELKAGGFFSLFSDAISKELREVILPCIFNHGSCSFEIPLLRKDGDVRIMSFSGFRVEDSEIACGAIASDITEKKELENALIEAKEAAETANRAKSQFLANVSHEIRTPMNAVISMTDLLLEDVLPERQRVYLEDIRSSGITLLGIINDILDFSKIESGAFVIAPVHFDLFMMLENLTSIFEFIANEKDLSFTTITGDGLPQYLYGDDLRIKQVLTNILSNAVKFTNEGGVTLQAWADEQRVYFDVIDTGIGIKEKDLDELFISFRQLDSAANRLKTGTGLGLSIVKSLVDLMEGRILVDSEYGAGSIFHVEIPRVDGDPNEITMIEKVNVTRLRAPDATVLVVDDYEPNLRVAKGLLGLLDIACDTAQDGETAIGLISRNQYDLVLMDHMMPGMDGVETTHRIRDMGYNNTSLPIIALTANSVVGVKEMLLGNGMNDFLPKPINRKQFVDTLAKWLPPEKIRLEAAEIPAETENSAYSEGLRKLCQIKKLDVESGLALLGGAQEVYLDTLRGLCRRIPETLSNMTACLADGNVDRFSIDIHGLKGLLAATGIHEMSKEAVDMETHAQKKDIAFCRNVFPGFSSRLLSLNKEIHSALSQIDEDRLPDPQTPVAAALKILSCLESLDDLTALDLLDGMEGSDYGEEGNALIRVLKRQIELFEYGLAKISADSLLKYFTDWR